MVIERVRESGRRGNGSWISALVGCTELGLIGLPRSLGALVNRGNLKLTVYFLPSSRFWTFYELRSINGIIQIIWR